MLSELNGVAKATQSGFQLLGTLGRWFAARRQRNKLVRDARELLGISNSDLYSYRVALHHPLVQRGNPHPDDLAAFTEVVDPEVAEAQDRNMLALVDDVPVKLTDGLVLIGSPEAEAVTSLAFGYERKADGSGMRYLGDSVDLPYRWEEDQNLVRAVCGRIVPGRGRIERPNWPIIDQTGHAARALYPTVGNDGLIYTDLLLITKVPNFLTVESFQSNRSIVSIAGTHGTATRAIGCLLRDRAALARIARTVGDAGTAFQILVEAGDVEHTERRGSVAKSVRVRDVRCFGRSDSAWYAGMRAVRDRYPHWLAESSRP